MYVLTREILHWVGHIGSSTISPLFWRAVEETITTCVFGKGFEVTPPEYPGGVGVLVPAGTHIHAVASHWALAFVVDGNFDHDFAGLFEYQCDCDCFAMRQGLG